MWGYQLRGFLSSPGERLGRADGGGDGEKGADIRAILGVELIRLSGGIESGGRS